MESNVVGSLPTEPAALILFRIGQASQNDPLRGRDLQPTFAGALSTDVVSHRPMYGPAHVSVPRAFRRTQCL